VAFAGDSDGMLRGSRVRFLTVSRLGRTSSLPGSAGWRAMTDSFDLRRFVNAKAPLRGDVKKGRQEAGITTNFPIAIRVTAATRLALECAAAVAVGGPDSLKAFWRGRWPMTGTSRTVTHRGSGASPCTILALLVLYAEKCSRGAGRSRPGRL
jgi:hypothetical protein